jgi:hypothetical protein
VSSDPLFPCCQSSVAGTSRFGIRSHARRYSDLAIPSSLKLLTRAHCGDLAHQRETGASSQSAGLTPGGMLKSAARALNLLPYRSRRDVAVCGAMAQAAHREDGPTDGMRGEKSAIMRIGRKPDVSRRSPSKGQGQGRVQMEHDQSENSR